MQKVFLSHLAMHYSWLQIPLKQAVSGWMSKWLSLKAFLGWRGPCIVESRKRSLKSPTEGLSSIILIATSLRNMAHRWYLLGPLINRHHASCNYENYDLYQNLALYWQIYYIIANTLKIHANRGKRNVLQSLIAISLHVPMYAVFCIYQIHQCWCITYIAMYVNLI